jgi:hypothetical protein
VISTLRILKRSWQFCHVVTSKCLNVVFMMKLNPFVWLLLLFIGECKISHSLYS